MITLMIRLANDYFITTKREILICRTSGNDVNDDDDKVPIKFIGDFP